MASTAADIGTHAWHLATFVTSLEMQRVRAEFHVCGRPKAMEDTAFMNVRYAGGVPGTLAVSQVAAGERGFQQLRLYGDKGRLEWLQSAADKLHYTPLGEAEQVITRGAGGGVFDETQRYVALPRGYNEGWFEAWANIYTELAIAIEARRDGRTLPAGYVEYPTVEDGARGIKFVAAAVASNADGGSWQDCTLTWTRSKRVSGIRRSVFHPPPQPSPTRAHKGGGSNSFTRREISPVGEGGVGWG